MPDIFKDPFRKIFCISIISYIHKFINISEKTVNKFISQQKFQKPLKFYKKYSIMKLLFIFEKGAYKNVQGYY